MTTVDVVSRCTIPFKEYTINNVSIYKNEIKFCSVHFTRVMEHNKSSWTPPMFIQVSVPAMEVSGDV
jgi:hypothetical protein